MRKTQGDWPPHRSESDEDVVSEWDDENRKTVEASPDLVAKVRQYDDPVTAPHKLEQLELAHGEAAIAQAFQDGFTRGQSATFKEGMEVFESALRMRLYTDLNYSLRDIDEFIMQILPHIKFPTT